MTVNECIQAYRDMAKRAFSPEAQVEIPEQIQKKKKKKGNGIHGHIGIDLGHSHVVLFDVLRCGSRGCHEVDDQEFLCGSKVQSRWV